MKKLLKVCVVTILVLCAFLVVACNKTNDVSGKYYEEQGDGTLNAASWIEITRGGNWQDDEGEAGTYKLDGQNITFYQDKEEVFDGTVVNGVLTIGNVVFRKEPAPDNGDNNKYDIILSQNIDAAGTVTGGGKYIVGAAQTITATTNAGYTWLGWYAGDTKVSTGNELTYSFTMPAENKAYEARWSVNSYTVTATKNIDNAGTVTGAGSKEYGAAVTLTATTNAGYTWLGWYDGETKVSTDAELTYSFTMPADNKTYQARWSVSSYTVTIIKYLNDNESELAGTVTGTGSKDRGATVTLTATTNAGYVLLGWFDGEEKVSGELTYTFIMPEKNKTFKVKWVEGYTLSVEKNIANAGTAIGAGFKGYNSSVTLTATTNPGYTWLGWFDGETKVSTDDELTYEFTIPAGNKTFEARWSVNSYNVTIIKYLGDIESELAGTASGAGSKEYGTAVTLTATANAGYVLLGWFDGDATEPTSTNLIFTFAMPAENKTFKAKWVEGYNLSIEKNLSNAGTVTGAGIKGQGSSVTLTATTNPGYKWLGWYEGENEVPTSTESIYTFTMPKENKSFLAKWEISSRVNVDINIEEAGTVTGDGLHEPGSSVTLTAITNEGYTWRGWYYGNAPRTRELTYTFTMSNSNQNYEARWMECPISLERNIPAAGTVFGVERTILGAQTTITATTNEGYTWLGWYDGETKVSTDDKLTYSFTMSEDNKTYQARWSVNSYTVTANKNIDNAGTVTGAGIKEYGVTVTLTATTNAGYTWLGWYEGETKVSTDDELTYEFTIPAEDKTYEARWKENVATVTFDGNGGIGSMSAVELATGDALPTKIFIKEGYCFAGWSESADGAIVYKDKEEVVIADDVSEILLYARWIQFPERVDESGEIDIAGEYIFFGEYPQTIRAEGVTILPTQDSRGYYLGDDGCYYAQVTAAPYGVGFKFSTDTTVVGGTVYYFKVEPIKWRILSESNGEALILCESIIANKRYAESSNNYMESEIRAWLNNQFYNTAFSDLQQALIQTIEVDNSADSTGHDPNQYACANTLDNIFLPSYSDMINTDYGFSDDTDSSDTAKIRAISDYSIATGADASSSANGMWWLRSPAYDINNFVNYCAGGYIQGRIVNSAYCGVVPALTIKLQKKTAIFTFNENEGAGTMTDVVLSTGDALPANEFVKEGYFFIGWSESADGDVVYEDKEEVVVADDGSEILLYAQWSNNFPERVNESGEIDIEGEYVFFGEYPQTIKADDVEITAEKDSRGYYLGDDGCYYAKVTATPYKGEYKFSNDTTVVGGTVYYFKIEPIKWRILSESNGEALILCESIIANKRYAASSNNYMESEIRAWLKNEFYNTAFNKLQQALIQTTEVDNSADSTGDNPNQYACANTLDKIFLLSYSDMINTSYGFRSFSSADSAKQKITSDYTRATGVGMNTMDYYGNGSWWLRSPYTDSDKAHNISINGYITKENVNHAEDGVVPALRILLY